MRPLDGITVLTLEHAVSAPFATRHLADLGARVIKVERPDGGDFARGYDETVLGLSSYFVWLNRSKGMHIQVSMLEALGEWMGCPLYYAHYRGTAPQRTGASHATIYPYGPFRTGGGKNVMLGVQNEREWAAFCERVLGCPEPARDPRFESNSRRVANRATLGSTIERVISNLTADEVLLRLEAAQIANARINDMKEVWSHPQLSARGRWREVHISAGTISTLLPPTILSTCEARMDGVPALGEHTDAVLAELGFAPEDIAGLRTDAVV